MKPPNRSQSLPNRGWCIPHSELPWVPLVAFQRNPYSPGQATPARNDLPSVLQVSADLNAAAQAFGQIPELVDLMMSFASEPLLYDCLFVCKAYNSIAKKYLWEKLSSAIPLLSLLGPIITTGKPDSPSASWNFRTPPNKSQRENLNEHAKLVKAIAPMDCPWMYGTTDYSRHLDQSKYGRPDAILCCNPAKCPMSLDALAIIESPETGVPHPQPQSIGRFSLIPNLEHLTFSFGNPYTAPNSFLPFIGPKLETLNLHYHICLKNIAGGHLIGCVSESLQLLAMPFSTHGPLPFLQRLQICLDNRYLAINLGYEAINEAILNVLDGCKHVRDIELPSFSSHERLLSKLRELSHLATLTVSFNTDGEMMLFAEGLASSHLNLRKLRLAHHGYSPTPMRILTPLLKLSRLVLLSIKSYAAGVISSDGLPWNLSPMFLQDLSEAWPSLESFSFFPSQCLTIQSLASFQNSNLFPHLTHLALRIDSGFHEPPAMKTVSAALRLMRPLRSLQTLAMDTPGGWRPSPGEMFAMITYAERIGPSKLKVLLNGEPPRGRYDSLQSEGSIGS
ncbi:hypothetical protein M407DRAFT_26959 [Tulasnella calospora MUT 4182]|uniref:Uncharacterized protein n=1 Tax=Tulasnella calospora MUT 4182 TaxID=1051891 RepID=A0A0C3LQ80_9AGAM|nr:hypothetical protein M407DRAFT_26959 [Tulasnella calospora MUT 4182]